MHPRDHLALTGVLFVMLLALGAFAVVQQVQLTSLRQRVARVESLPVAQPAAPATVNAAAVAEPTTTARLDQIEAWKARLLAQLNDFSSSTTGQLSDLDYRVDHLTTSLTNLQRVPASTVSTAPIPLPPSNDAQVQQLQQQVKQLQNCQQSIALARNTLGC